MNVLGSANFARIGVVFLRKDIGKGENRSLTLLSSVNAFRESPGLYMYQVSYGLRPCVYITESHGVIDIEARDTRLDAVNAQDHLRERRDPS